MSIHTTFGSSYYFLKEVQARLYRSSERREVCSSLRTSTTYRLFFCQSNQEQLTHTLAMNTSH